jgi:MFS transporter, FSR family, fosmidomycin resistance protein
MNASARQDATVISLIGLAHGTSHFFHMLLPPLFPAFIRDFGLSYSELGLLVSVFFVISGIGQALAGFVVDRIGARPVLWAAMGFFVAAALAAASAQGYSGLMLAAALAGVGNSPFHPADFSVLNKRVSPARLGHAFSVHGITGSLGWAAAPLVLVGISEATGSWRTALVCAAVLAALVLALLVLMRDVLGDHAPAAAAGAAKTQAAAPEHTLAFLRLPSVWLCFSFFLFSTAAVAAVQGFAGPALAQIHAVPVAAMAFVVTGYMLCSALGQVIGGFVAGRVKELERTIGVALCMAAACLLIAGTGVLPAVASAVVAAVAGLAAGLAGPSRDMLIKRAAPPGATGRVYGTVYSGLDVGFALGAPIFGALMDRGHASGVFYGAALALVLGVVAAAAVALATRARASQAVVRAT